MKAMLELVGAGDISPGAEAVAARAKVGLRTVFRHFENMESLYRQINALIEARIRPIAQAPLEASDWRSQLAEIMDRRVRIFESIMPYKIAGDAHRYRSAFLAAQSAALTREQRAALVAILPEERRADPQLLEGLDLLLSFDTWRRLRKDQKLSEARARQILQRLVAALLNET